MSRQDDPGDQRNKDGNYKPDDVMAVGVRILRHA